MIKYFAFLAVFLLAFSCKEDSNPVEAQTYGMVSGYVTEQITKTPLDFVKLYTVPATGVVTTNKDGYYEIQNIDAGEYRIYAMKDGFDSSSVNVKVQLSSITTANFVLQKYDSTKYFNYGTIKGIIRNTANNTVISNAIVKTTPPSLSVSSKADGAYELTKMTPGTYVVEATKAGYDTVKISIVVKKNEISVADIYLKQLDTTPKPVTGTISGLVLNSFDAKPLASATVTTTPSLSSVITDNAGLYEVKNVPPGKYKVKISKPGFTDSEKEISVTAGINTVANFTLQSTTGRISGTITDAVTEKPISGVNVYTTPGTTSVTTGADGKFVLENIPPGKFSLNTVKSGYVAGVKEIQVTAGNITTADVVMTLSE